MLQKYHKILTWQKQKQYSSSLLIINHVEDKKECLHNSSSAKLAGEQLSQGHSKQSNWKEHAKIKEMLTKKTIEQLTVILKQHTNSNTAREAIITHWTTNYPKSTFTIVMIRCPKPQSYPKSSKEERPEEESKKWS